MNKQIKESELILNDDGSIYHLHLLPDDIADTIILVGDQDRVPLVSGYFDKVEVKKHKREFVTHTGFIGKKRLSVISTGIGTDNIDIVLNELDALVNVDLNTREIKQQQTVLTFVRIGTSGALQPDLGVDSILISSHGLGLDALLNFYDYEETEDIFDLRSQIEDQLDLLFINPYLFKAPGNIINKFLSVYDGGITATCCGFYAPQGRTLRAETKYENLIRKLSEIKLAEHRITNFEMETAGIYGMAAVLGHEALSVNAILANRVTNTFSKKPEVIVKQAIEKTLEVLIA